MRLPRCSEAHDRAAPLCCFCDWSRLCGHVTACYSLLSIRSHHVCLLLRLPFLLQEQRRLQAELDAAAERESAAQRRLATADQTGASRALLLLWAGVQPLRLALQAPELPM